ncbi:glycosyl transferase family protein [Arthrobacter sp. PAMC 25486]|uniref:glycosyltransferase family 2 protein n=1 Tax=Arthrobacter sp. PAMC 25486 TaxID=1494608 RepID=UPI000535CD32|nr:glycosyltransferase family 2 protein [Arthrobacter sp. PAMC 25486]AIY01400.1 glycosyl transferase family protein [Arthrobacter sp. PAMC 25486]
MGSNRQSMRTIAVVIPSRNDAAMLAVCLAHLALQSRPADEIIVVDNASTDNTAEICAAAGVRRIFWPVPGVAGASARGFDAAGTDIIARIDADSRPGPDWLARVESDLTGAGPLALVTGPGDFYGGPRVVCWLGLTLYLGGYFHVVGLLLGHPPVFGSNYAMTSEVWERIGPAVTRNVPAMHDDLEVSYLLRPDMHVNYDAGLRMPVSARPFESWSSLGRRLVMAWGTFGHLFASERPLIRRRTRLRWARGH